MTNDFQCLITLRSIASPLDLVLPVSQSCIRSGASFCLCIGRSTRTFCGRSFQPVLRSTPSMVRHGLQSSRLPCGTFRAFRRTFQQCQVSTRCTSSTCALTFTWTEHRASGSFHSTAIMPLPSSGARTFYYLPYYNAELTLEQVDSKIDYSLARTDKPKANFRATWQTGTSLPTSEPGSLEFFLTERYCLFSEHKGQLYRSQIHHQSWPLKTVILDSHTSTMIDALKTS